MKHSIRLKMSVLLVGLTAAAIFTCIIINNLFLEDFYVDTRKNALIDIYKSINSTVNESVALTDEQMNTVFLQCENAGTSILLTDSSFRMLFSYGASKDKLVNRLMDIMFQNNTDNSSILINADNFVLQKTYDTGLKTYYLEMYGELDCGDFFVMRMPVTSITDVVDLANQFYIFVGIVVIILSAVIMLIVSYEFTKPIKKLANIAEKMSDLDFNVKYDGKGRNELAVLGHSMNNLSEKLEASISELKSANIELQKDIQKRTEIDEMRKDFLSNVSHELKTPLALIQGYAEGLKESVNDDSESRDFYCEVIMDETGKMNKMVKKLLDLNQIEFGSQKLNLERFNIISVINAILNSASIMILQKNVTVIFDNSSEIFVWADEFQIEEVITNYLSNALNHVDYENVIKIMSEVNSGIVTISVFNTGKHIPEDSLDNVWVKFYKVDKARTREYGGSGIGLSIVKAIMDSHNRECGVENVDGGVRFWFTLDCAKD